MIGVIYIKNTPHFGAEWGIPLGQGAFDGQTWEMLADRNMFQPLWSREGSFDIFGRLPKYAKIMTLLTPAIIFSLFNHDENHCDKNYLSLEMSNQKNYLNPPHKDYLLHQAHPTLAIQ